MSTTGKLPQDDSLIIREIGPPECAALARFFQENNIPTILRQFHPFPLTSETANSIACSRHRDRYYAALMRDRIVAFSMLRGWDEGYSVPSLGILVDFRFHGKGLGTRMLSLSLDEARRLECKRVRLSVYASNRAALRLYEGMGFVELTRESVVVAGEPDEKIVMLNNL